MGLRNAFPDLGAAGSGVLVPIAGTLPDLAHPPEGCRFAARCPFAQDRCRTTAPLLETVAPGHRVACHRADEAAQLRRRATESGTWAESEGMLA